MPEIETKSIDNDTLLTTFIPTDYSDVGQGTLLSDAYRNKLRYCEGVGWMFYKDGVWTQSESAARMCSQTLTDLQLQEATALKLEEIHSNSKSSRSADAYFAYANSRRSSARITAALTEATPRLGIKASMLDAEPLIINTPDGEIHLDTGELLPHDPDHLITRMTVCSMSDKGTDEWNNFIRQITCDDAELASFLKQMAGMFAIGKVYEERLLIALGTGGNGKSTFFNALLDVLGDYAGSIRSELLVASNDSGKKFELARLRGMRLAVAEELEEGRQLDTAAVKNLCSTGDINAQFKGKDPFTFKPSHSIVLCTNHMPSVKVIDSGTWDRLIVIPFNGRFRNQSSEIKNYGRYLSQNCGGAILSWIVEGALEYISNQYKLVIPDCVNSATQKYQQDNDWLDDFFEENIEIDCFERAYGREIYEAYLLFCRRRNENPLPMATAIPMIAAKADVTRKRSKKGNFYMGIRIKHESDLIES